MNQSPARTAVIDALAAVLQIDPATIRDEALLEPELGADSLAVVEAVFGVEARLGIRLRDDVVREVRTVADLIAAVTA